MTKIKNFFSKVGKWIKKAFKACMNFFKENVWAAVLAIVVSILLFILFINDKNLYYMIKFLNSLKPIMLFMLAFTLITMGVTAFFNSMFINAVSIIIAIFILIAAADIFDKNNNLGKYNQNKS
jgi:hypothetical protein